MEYRFCGSTVHCELLEKLCKVREYNYDIFSNRSNKLPFVKIIVILVTKKSKPAGEARPERARRGERRYYMTNFYRCL